MAQSRETGNIGQTKHNTEI